MDFLVKTQRTFTSSVLPVLVISVVVLSSCNQGNARALKNSDNKQPPQQHEVQKGQPQQPNNTVCGLHGEGCPPQKESENAASKKDQSTGVQEEAGVSLQKQLEIVAEDQKNIEENMKFLRTKLKTVSEDKLLKVAKYLSYIKLKPKDTNYKKDVSRLLESSTQFILCESIEDLACLEDSPAITPSKDLRIDVKAGLGKAVNAGTSLDIEYYFTRAWYDNHKKQQKPFIIPEMTVAKRLAEKISAPDVKSMSMAIYGIDDISDSMASVYQAVQKRVEERVPVKAVVDVSDATQPSDMIRDYDLVKNTDGTYTVINMPGALDLSYVNPPNISNWAFGAPKWTIEFLRDVEASTKGMTAPKIKDYLSKNVIKFHKDFKGNQSTVLGDILWIALNKKSTDAETSVTRMAYQYLGTQDFLRVLNANAPSNDEAAGHIEYPYAGIMHNKFVVFENQDQSKSVWSGTANVARTCMGSEENANMAIYVKNTFVAQAFQDEFNEMYGPSRNEKPESLLTGAFHTKKRPNTQRYFKFDDGTQVRVHFSPTDDAEHRVILPMLYSARRGDIIRISMFGSGGYELVRALQSAAARGVDLKIAVDKLSGAGVGSWIKSSTASLMDKNPYPSQAQGLIEVRKNDWSGLNHYKVATLTRRMSDGQYRPETIIIGSQNWSTSGNDLNDENVITISNKTKALPIMKAYNDEFDAHIWSASSTILKQ